MRNISGGIRHRSWMMSWLFLAPLIMPVNAVAQSAEPSPSIERVALMLTGAECPEQRNRIAIALSEFSAVRRVEFETVPDHVLVDVVSGAVSAEALQQAVQRGMGESRGCQVEVLKSCISASPVSPTP